MSNMCKYNFFAQEWIEVKLYIQWKYLLCFINAHTVFLLFTAKISMFTVLKTKVLTFSATCLIWAFLMMIAVQGDILLTDMLLLLPVNKPINVEKKKRF